MKSAKILAVACAALCFLTNPTLRADDLYIWAEEIGGHVIFFHEGSIDLTGFPVGGAYLITEAYITPESGAYWKSVGARLYDNTLPNGSTRTFGSAMETTPDYTSGDDLGLSQNAALLLPYSYVSGDPISGTMTFLSTDFVTLGIDTTPFSFDTTVGTNTIHLFTDPSTLPPVLPPANENAFANASEKSALFRGIKGLQKKAKKLKKKGQKAKAKKVLKKVKKLKQQLAALG